MKKRLLPRLSLAAALVFLPCCVSCGQKDDPDPGKETQDPDKDKDKDQPVDDGKPRTRTGENNYYYLSKDNKTQGVDYINTFAGSTFQEKAVNYVVNTLGIPYSTVQDFQEAMLEPANTSDYFF